MKWPLYFTWDHTIGEYNSMTRIEKVEIKKLQPFKSKKGFITFDDFRMELENDFAWHCN
jgi:hypothetical protein